MAFRKIISWTLTAMLMLSAVLSTAAAAETEGVLEDWKTETYTSKTGFSFEVISDEEEGFIWGKTQNGIGARWVDEQTYNTLYEEFVIHGVTDYKENPEDALAFYDRYAYQDGETILAQKDLEIEGHPARIVLRASLQGGLTTYIGNLYYVRNNTVLKVRLMSIPPQDARQEPPKVTETDMTKIAAGIHYDETMADLRQEDGQFQIGCREELSEIIAGKSLNFSADFFNGRVQKDAKLNAVTWQVADASGETPYGVSISAKGQLTTKKQISEVLYLTVSAQSELFHTSASFEVTVIPIVSRIAVEPATMTLYLSPESEGRAKASIIPENIPPIGLTWKADKKGNVDITPEDDGEIVIRPLKAGKTSVTVRELGGKTAQVRVKVIEPVTDMELAVNGTPRAGRIVRMTVNLIPRSAGVKDVGWSLDVDESIAKISSRGNISISPDTPAGTMITVTCVAYGAPEPVSKYITFTVQP